ncbi:MAG: hypothetical protein ABIO70_11050 [Pseudomonadota bacterium]
MPTHDPTRSGPLRLLKAYGLDGLCLLALLGALAWMMGPGLLSPADWIVGHQSHPGLQGDMIFQWNLWRQMAEGHLPRLLHSPYLAFPGGQDFALRVAFSLNLAIDLVFLRVFGLWRGHGLGLAFTLWLNGAAMYALARWRGAGRGFALGAALVFAFGPYAGLKLSQGFTHKMVIFPIPLFLLALLAALREPRPRAWALLAAAAGLVTWAYPPYLGFCLVLTAPMLLGELARRRGWRPWVAPVAALAGVAALVGTGAWLVGHHVVAPAAMDLGIGHFFTEGGYLEPANLVRWFPYLDVPHGAPQEFVRGLPLGLPLLAGALTLAAALRPGRERGLALGALALLVLMAGPWPLHDGELVALFGRVVPLPLRYLSALPLGSVFRMPIRSMPVVQAGLLLAAAGVLVRLRVRGLSAGQRGLLQAAVGLAMVLEGWFVFPEYHRLVVQEVATPSFCQEPGVLGPGALYHLPLTTAGPHVQGYISVLCDRPMVNADLFGEPSTVFPRAAASQEEKLAFLTKIVREGTDTVVVHRGEASSVEDLRLLRAAESWLVEACGEPLLDERWNLAAYRIPRAFKEALEPGGPVNPPEPPAP